jgi:O-methyltransferase
MIGRSAGRRVKRSFRSLIGPEPKSPTRDLEPEFLALEERCTPFSMVGTERMYGLYTAVRHITISRVPGAVVECGVWRGGCMMLAALTLQREMEERQLFLFDTFAGMTKPTERDTGPGGLDAISMWHHHRKADKGNWLSVSLEEVKSNLSQTNYPEGLITFAQGDVLSTIPEKAPDEIALLRLDTDWYESTKHELEHLYPRLAPGGVLIIDDYGQWKGAKDAVDEYLSTLDSPPFLMRTDYTGRMGVKPG